MKQIFFLLLLCSVFGCSREDAHDEVLIDPLFVSEGRRIEAWIYEVGYDADKPWKSKFITRIKGRDELSLASFSGNADTTYRVCIMSPGRANYTFRINEKESGREYRLFGLAVDEELPERVFLQDELIAILEGRVNTTGAPDLVGPDTEYFRYAIAHSGIPKWIGVDYQGRQSEAETNWIIGDKLYLDCFRQAKDFGVVKIPAESFHSKRIEDGLEWKNIDIELKAGDCYYFKTYFGKYMGVFRVVTVDYFTDEDIQIFRSHKRN